MKSEDLQARLESRFAAQAGGERTDWDDLELMRLGREAQVAGLGGGAVEESARRAAERLYPIHGENSDAQNMNEYQLYNIEQVARLITLVRSGWTLSELRYWRE